MEIIPPVKLTLAGSSSPSSYVRTAWATSTYYARNSVIRHQVNGIWYDFRAVFSHTSSSSNAPYAIGKCSFSYIWCWLGVSAITAGNISYNTDVDLSQYPTWSSGSAVTAGQSVFDDADKMDYVALSAITAGNNTTRPSAAVLSSDETIAGYWAPLGPANAWAALDYEMATRMRGISSGAILQTAAGMLFLPANPSINLIASPNDFNTGWTLSNATHSTSTENDPTTMSASISVITASGSNGKLTRTWTGYKIGDKVVFAVWARSSTISGFTISFTENSVQKQSTTFTVASGKWQYYQAEYTLTETGITLGVIIGGLTTTGNSIKLWGSHFGLCADAFNRYALMGVKNCRSLTVAFLAYSTAYDMWPAAGGADTVMAFPEETRRDVLRSFNVVKPLFTLGDSGSWISLQSNTDTLYLTSVSAFRLLMSPRNPAKMMELASFGMGEATYIGGTEWGVETSMLSFSRKERNETFGTVTFVKRGTSKVVRATAFIDPDVISGDEVQSILAQFDGVPVFWDFNNDGSDYDRLRVMGFHTNVRQLIQAATYESLSIDIEGLVE